MINRALPCLLAKTDFYLSRNRVSLEDFEELLEEWSDDFVSSECEDIFSHMEELDEICEVVIAFACTKFNIK